jgi:hypothetical protein
MRERVAADAGLGAAARGAPATAQLEERLETIVVGGGAAGLAVAAALARRGIGAVVLERDAIGERWRGRYDGLRLNTLRSMSGLPGMAIPRAHGRWPARDAFVDYLELYARRLHLDVRCGVGVRRIVRGDDDHVVETTAGEVQARFVIVAIGRDNQPAMPDWEGSERFPGQLIHAAAYRSPAPYRGRRVLVVGAGNSGSEIATQLARGGATEVQMSLRTPPNIMRRTVLGVPMTRIGRLTEWTPTPLADAAGAVTQRLLWGDLAALGLGRAPLGIASDVAHRGRAPVIDDGFVAAVKRGELTLVGPLERFDRADAVLAGGRRLRPDAVIAATGYRCGLEPLVGDLDVLDETGAPSLHGALTHPSAPRVYFAGYATPLTGQLPSLRRTASRIARSIGQEQDDAR